MVFLIVSRFFSQHCNYHELVQMLTETVQMLSESEISTLLEDPKPISSKVISEALSGNNFKTSLYNKHSVWSHSIKSKSGRIYVLTIRINVEYSNNFSVILRYKAEDGIEYNLRRHNGIHAPHTNQIEKNKVTGYHIHKATERYQMKRKKIDTYAEKTDDYTDWKGAFTKMLDECGFARDINPLSYYSIEVS